MTHKNEEKAVKPVIDLAPDITKGNTLNILKRGKVMAERYSDPIAKDVARTLWIKELSEAVRINHMKQQEKAA